MTYNEFLESAVDEVIKKISSNGVENVKNENNLKTFLQNNVRNTLIFVEDSCLIKKVEHIFENKILKKSDITFLPKIVSIDACINKILNKHEQFIIILSVLKKIKPKFSYSKLIKYAEDAQEIINKLYFSYINYDVFVEQYETISNQKLSISNQKPKEILEKYAEIDEKFAELLTIKRDYEQILNEENKLNPFLKLYNLLKQNVQKYNFIFNFNIENNVNQKIFALIKDNSLSIDFLKNDNINTINQNIIDKINIISLENPFDQAAFAYLKIKEAIINNKTISIENDDKFFKKNITSYLKSDNISCINDEKLKIILKLLLNIIKNHNISDLISFFKQNPQNFDPISTIKIEKLIKFRNNSIHDYNTFVKVLSQYITNHLIKHNRCMIELLIFIHKIAFNKIQYNKNNIYFFYIILLTLTKTYSKDINVSDNINKIFLLLIQTYKYCNLLILINDYSRILLYFTKKLNFSTNKNSSMYKNIVFRSQKEYFSEQYDINIVTNNTIETKNSVNTYIPSKMIVFSNNISNKPIIFDISIDNVVNCSKIYYINIVPSNSSSQNCLLYNITNCFTQYNIKLDINNTNIVDCIKLYKKYMLTESSSILIKKPFLKSINPTINIRPMSFSCTEIQFFIKNPYKIYAKHILKLQSYYQSNKQEKGNILHKILEQLIKEYDFKKNSIINNINIENYVKKESISIWNFKISDIKKWIIDNLHNAHLKQSLSEIRGEIYIDGFKITAIADRIDIKQDNSCRIIDYKTGTLPTQKEINSGMYSQLLIEGVILKYGKFENLDSNILDSLEFWKIGKNNSQYNILKNKNTQIESTLLGLKRILKESLEKPYTAYPIKYRFMENEDVFHLSRAIEIL